MNKKPIAWIVDSTAFISEELKQHPDFFSVPLNIHFGEEQFVDGKDLTPEQLYVKIKDATEFPKTSQPSAGEFAERFKEIAEGYDEAVAVHVSAKLSGTLASSTAGAEIAGFPVTFIDSLALSYGITGIIEKGMAMHAGGATVPEIKEQLEKMAGTLQNFILIGQLDQLYKGGRMSGVQFFLGSLLKVKPIVQISKEGELLAIDKVRSEKKALQYLVDKVATSPGANSRKIYLMHGNVIDQAIHLKNLLTEQVPGLEVVIGDISSTLAVHAGEGTLAILWFD
ncbi:DegV family protein [Sporosarcina limicola]|uniref:DegV family protein with EDD domain n=1 Tax=Sporosarcina limicola TaxID=34101 RepID=A0A927MPA8_9BACL|nr:DegV family protein [Sporosarcina limicola]MBE1555084.1 DegV family protein with EDD domain [Sporosarcina limicola]